MNPIIPTIFAKNKKQFLIRFHKLLPVSKDLQIDFMDGKFVKSKSVLISQIPNLKKYKNNFEAHLMVKNPIREIRFLKEKGFSKIIFHYEAVKKDKMMLKILSLTKKVALKIFIAINPETEIGEITPYLNLADGILIMGVHPGKEHQLLIPKTLKKIRELRRINKKIKIQVDGGVNEITASKLFKAGADYINSGSFISEAENPKASLGKLLTAFKK